MAEELSKVGGTGTGLGVVLSAGSGKENSQKAHLVSYCDDIGYQSVERAIEHVLGLPHKSILPLKGQPVDSSFVRSLLRRGAANISCGKSIGCRGGICFSDKEWKSEVVVIDETSVCGDIKYLQYPGLIESLALFSSVRANACVWRGKWMYEAVLETSGIQQLGWATVSCPFTDYKGVGDADDSYAFDGKRVNKWNVSAEPYGQKWVVGDVIGCCIDLDKDEISFYRNGDSMGVAFDGVRKMAPGLGYFPAVSLSRGERCDLNFGARPFKHPVNGFSPVQALPKQYPVMKYLLRCLSKLLLIQENMTSDSISIESLRRLKRYVSIEDLFDPIANGICEELFSMIDVHPEDAEYVTWGPFLSILTELFGAHPPHNHASVDKIVHLILKFTGSHQILQHLINALSSCCKTAALVLTECPYSGSYPYLALATHLLRHKTLMNIAWSSSNFEFFLEGLLCRKGVNKQDLQHLIPSVWWPGSMEDSFSENSMALTTIALSETVNKIEELHRELCLLVMQFIPPSTTLQLPGSVFRSFLHGLIHKNKGADHNVSQPGFSSNSVLVSVYTVILHLLSEVSPARELTAFVSDFKSGSDQSFLHRGGTQRFPLSLILKPDPQRTEISRLGGSYNYLLKYHPVYNKESEWVNWNEGVMDEVETKITHSTKQKPCCCSYAELDLEKQSKDPFQRPSTSLSSRASSISVRANQVEAECSTGSINDDIVDKQATNEQSEMECRYRQIQELNCVPTTSHFSRGTLSEEELLDALLSLYHLGMAPNFKQAAYYVSHQSQLICLMEDTDKQIRERSCPEHLKRLKDARNTYREELLDCVRQCAWYRISMFSRWKQRGMYATCMYIVQLLLVLSEDDSFFSYVPEFYVEAMVDCFHALRRSDPPFVSSTVFIKHGLSSFVTFIVTHFNDPRISSADLKDLLLQSISVLVQYKDYMRAFEMNQTAIDRLPRALLSAFDNRSWIPVANILLRLCKGSGFGSSRNGEVTASSLFQALLRKTFIWEEELFSFFLNQLFNTLSWTITEFSVSVQGMQECYSVIDLQQRKCSVIFDLSCNLTRVLELCTHEIPQAFLCGPEMNLRRLIELVVFVLNHTISVADAEFLEMGSRRQGQHFEKLNRAMILLPIVGIIINLIDASSSLKEQRQNDLVGVFASMDCSLTVLCGFQYLLDYNWGTILKDADWSLLKLRKLEQLAASLRKRADDEKLVPCLEEGEENLIFCCICYAGQVDAKFKPCLHSSCFGCITRHLLNSQRCFFCNATVLAVERL